MPDLMDEYNPYCEICFEEDIPFAKIEDCGHRMCEVCYKDHLIANLNIDAEKTPCPFKEKYECCYLVPPSLFQKLLNEESYKKYKEFAVKGSTNIDECVG